MSKKYLEAVKKQSLGQKIATAPFAIILVISLYVIASICWFVQHCYNLCTGKGWTGLKLI